MLEKKIVTLTIDENGDLVFLKTDGADIFLELGETVTRRASHVEPADWKRRILFTILRALVNDKSRIAAWTRTWQCWWRVNTSPVGGPILRWSDIYNKSWGDGIAVWWNRQHAIDEEVRFLNQWFLNRGIRG